MSLDYLATKKNHLTKDSILRKAQEAVAKTSAAHDQAVKEAAEASEAAMAAREAMQKADEELASEVDNPKA